MLQGACKEKVQPLRSNVFLSKWDTFFSGVWTIGDFILYDCWACVKEQTGAETCVVVTVVEAGAKI